MTELIHKLKTLNAKMAKNDKTIKKLETKNVKIMDKLFEIYEQQAINTIENKEFVWPVYEKDQNEFILYGVWLSEERALKHVQWCKNSQYHRQVDEKPLPTVAKEVYMELLIQAFSDLE